MDFNFIDLNNNRPLQHLKEEVRIKRRNWKKQIFKTLKEKKR